MYEEDKCNNNCYYTGCKQRKNRCCIDIIIYILSILIALTLGLIIASIPVIGAILFAAIATLIVLAVILVILIIIRIIQLVCERNKNKCC